MHDKNSGQGLYESQVVIGPETRRSHFEIEYRLTDASGKHKKAVSPAKVKVQNKTDFTQLEIISDEAVVRAGPIVGSEQMGYDLFLPKGSRVLSDGRAGVEHRLRLASTESGWSDEKNFKVLPAYVPFPRTVVDIIKIQHKKRSAVISIETKDPVPFRIRESRDLKTLTLSLYYAVSNIDRVRYDTNTDDRLIQELRWIPADCRQSGPGFFVKGENLGIRRALRQRTLDIGNTFQPGRFIA